MFIEMPVKTEISSVGAASEHGTYRSFGACEFASKFTINIPLLWSWGNLCRNLMLESLRYINPK
jgi:hypothetical protein